MCGLAGFLDPTRSRSAAELEATVAAMAGTVLHRGPDDGGTWVDPEAGVALGHRRLAIIDVSPMGAQPMASADGRWVLAYNGELYGTELADRLRAEGVAFRGHSDTEALVEAISRWGVREALAHANGMFAFAAWDRRERTVTLARDRMGEKPLYYGWAGRSFVFGSELKALRAHPDLEPRVDRRAVATYLRHNAVPAPWTIYEGVSKLRPGEVLTVHADGRLDGPEPYWSVVDVARAGLADPFDAGPDELHRFLGELLGDAVGRRMVSDVPLGAFLSGGVDSSLVVALMQERSSRPVRTFTIGFSDRDFDEAPHAAAVAAHLGTDHTELQLTPDDVLAVVPRLPAMYDEPFADSSQLPTHLVSALARRHVTVALSGDGGDELFAGYDRYALFGSLWSRLGRIPAPGRAAAASLIRVRPASWWNRAGEVVGRAVPPARRFSRPGDKLHKLARILDGRDAVPAYRVLMSQWQDPSAIVAGVDELPTVLVDPPTVPGGDVVRRLQLLDQLQYLPDDILVKVDRASMAVSLEARVPLLDHRVVEAAWRVPTAELFHDGKGKWPLRRLLLDRVPASIVDRPKMGFAVPIGAWLRGPLREWAEELLAVDRLTAAGLEATPVRAVWAEHLARDDDWAGSNDLWTVLMLQAWLAGA